MSRERSARSEYRAFHKMTTRWADNDSYGDMNNVVHYSLFDSTINTWLIERDLLDLKGGNDAIGLVVETSCRYHAEMSFPDIIVAGFRVGRIGNSSVRYEIGLFRNGEEQAAAEGAFTHVYVDRATRRPKALSDRMKAELSQILVELNYGKD